MQNKCLKYLNFLYITYWNYSNLINMFLLRITGLGKYYIKKLHMESGVKSVSEVNFSKPQTQYINDLLK